jgi:hypothetical protein
MKRAPLALVAVAALTVLSTHQAGAAAKKAAPKPVKQTMWFHGTQQLGNIDQNAGFPGTSFMSMNATKPTGSGDKDILFFGLAATPNTQCAGSSLLPSWSGAASGTLTGTATVSFYARSTPGATAKVQLFNDVEGQLCNADYPAPLGEAVVSLAAGPTATLHTVTFKIQGKGKVFGSLMVQIVPGSAAAGLVGPQLSSVVYDSTASPSSVTFSCIPKAGKKRC